MLILVICAFSISVNPVATGTVTEATNLSVGIVDEDGSDLSRRIAEGLRLPDIPARCADKGLETPQRPSLFPTWSVGFGMRWVAQAPQVAREMGIFRHAGTTLGLSGFSWTDGFVARRRRLHFTRAGRKEWRKIEGYGRYWSMGALPPLPPHAVHRPSERPLPGVARLAANLTG
jgi:hypothetical protein